MTMENEIWKPVPNWGHAYEVSSLGRIRRIAYSHLDTIGRHRVRPCCIINPVPCGKGYLKFGPSSGKRENVMVHRAVAEAFIPNPDSKRTVNHKNGVRTDNRVTNLEWATYSENLIHRHTDLGFVIKLTVKDVLEIRAMSGVNPKEIARRKGIHWATVYKILNRRIWAHV